MKACATEEQKQFIIANWDSMSAKAIAREIGLSATYVSALGRRLGCQPKRSHRGGISSIRRATIIKYAEAGKSSAQIAALLQEALWTVNQIIEEHNQKTKGNIPPAG